MDWRAGLIWIVLLALLWIGWTQREWLRLRDQARQRQAAARNSVVQQHSDAGMQLLKEKKWSEAAVAFDRALNELRPRQQSGAEYQDDPRQEVSMLFYRGFALEQMGKLEEAIAAYADCQAIYPVGSPLPRGKDQGSPPSRQERGMEYRGANGGRLHRDPQYVAAVRQGLLLAKLERHQEAEQHLRRTIATLQHAAQSVSWLQVEAFQVLVGLFHRARDHARAIEYAQEGARVAHRLRDAAAQAGFLRAAGDALHALDHPDEALRSYEQSLDLYRRIGETDGEAMVKRDTALLYQSKGKWDKALAWLQACLVDEERDQNKQGQAQLCYDIACVHIDQGNLLDAGRLLQQSISLFRETEDHKGIDQVGRTMMGLSILVHRRVTADQMTFRDVERGSARSKKEGD